MFYDRFVELCETAGVSPSRAAIEAGISKSLVSKWKKDQSAIPTGSVLEKLSAYFGKPISEIMGEKEKLPVSEDQELADLLEELKNRPECRMLFQLAKGATAEEVRQAVKVIEALRK